MADTDRTPPDTPDDRGPTVVGIGASAGGLAALKTFFEQVPADGDLAFVVVMHLSPEHESHLAELLQPHVAMPVQQVTETTALEAGRVYVIPPGANLTAVDSHLRLSELEERRRERAPIDHFFRTLSETHDGNSVAVVLTGTGSDGTLGLREIKERAGLTVVQDPAEAEYDGMPQSAIATGMVDLILPVAEIPGAVLRFASTEPKVPVPDDGEEPEPEERMLLHKVFAQVRARTGRDFSRYKRSTILRRIARRMQLAHVEELPAYLDLLRENADEVRALADDLLINVTNFFRDPEAFRALEREVVPEVFEGKAPDDTVRVWSVGCSTGEEAYTLAILLLEEAARREVAPRIQVFASDLHERSLERAREGFYPGDIEADVSPERLDRFFEKEDGGYRVRKEVRELVVFAPHNLLGDPPFSKLDLVACRNVLIYLQRDVQKDVVELFHYALRPDGYLLLGSSETVGSADLFRVEDKKHCLYRKRNVPAPEPRLPVFPMAHRRLAARSGDGEAAALEPLAYGALHHRMVEAVAPPSLLVSPDDKVVHLSEHAGRYLVHPGGEITASVYKLVRKELRIELRASLHAARERGEPVRSKAVPVRFDGHAAPVVLDVRPSADPSLEGFALVIFDERAPVVAGERAPERGGGRVPGLEARLGAARERVRDALDHFAKSRDETEAADEAHEAADRQLRAVLEALDAQFGELRQGAETRGPGAAAGPSAREAEAELDLMRRRLQTIIEEYDTSQEEMKASNEELQSANEELRSTMEELETSKEELQSMNEELQTVNQENRHKVEELAQLSGDLQNLMASTDIATLFLDRDLRIMRFTPRVGELFNVRPVDRGRPLTDITHRLGYPDIEADAARVLRSFVPIEREVEDEAGRWYIARTLPYRSTGDRIEGVVLTFVDVTARKEAEAEVRRAKESAERIIDTLHEPLLVLTPDLRVQSANPAFYAHFEVDRADTEGRRIYDLGNGQWAIPELRRLLEDVLPENESFDDYEVTHEFEEIGARVMLLNARRLAGSELILLGVRDITERKRAEDALRESEARYRNLFDAMTEGFCVVEVLYDEGGAPTDHRIVEANPAFTRHSGLEAPVGKRASDLAPGLEAVWNEIYDRVIRTGEPEHFVRGSAALGRVFEVEVSRVAGPPEARVGVLFTDVTERKRAEETVRESEERLQMALSIPTVGVLFWDADFRLAQVNDAFLQMTGFSREEAIGMTWQELTPEEFHPASERTVASIEAAGEAPPYEKQYVRKDGSRFWGLFAPRKIGEDEAVEFVLDVTERKRAEEAIRESEERFRTLAETVPDAVFTAAPDGTVDYVNRQHEALTGVDPDEVVGTTMWPELVHPDDREAAEAAWAGAHAAREPLETRYRLRHATGDYGWVIVRARPVFDEDGALERWFGTITDIDAVVRAEAEVRELNATLEARVEARTAQVRELARALTLAEQDERRRIAHVLHDDLQPTLAGAQIAAAQADLERLEAILDRAIHVARTLSHELSPPLLRGDDFRGLLDWLVEKKREDYGLAVELDVRGEVAVPEAHLRILLYQILRELLFNVVKHAGTDAARVTAERLDGHVRVVVEDEGAGFDPGALEGGTAGGLGLPSVRERLELVGGTVDVVSAPGDGTRVTMEFPTDPDA